MADEEIIYILLPRKEAKRIGSKHYFTNNSCKRGHISLRRVGSAGCCKCERLHNREWRSENLEELRRREREHYAANPEWARAKHRKNYDKNGDKIKERQKVRYAENPEKYRAASRDYHYNNLDVVNEKARIRSAEYREKFPEKVKAAIDKWWEENPGKKKVYHRNRRARKRSNGGTHTAEDIADIRRMQKDRCAMPSCRIKLYGGGHVDHIIALINDGPNDRKNLQILCEPCNLEKGAKDQTEFLRKKGFLL